MDWEIKPLDSAGITRNSLKKCQFESGQPDLDRYLKRFAWKNHELGVSRVFVACSANSNVIQGFYTSSTGALSTQSIPNLQDKFPQQTPALLIGRLAVDKSVQRQGLGKKLLKHAFESAIDISKKTGVWAVYVDAKYEAVKQYYQRFSFMPLKDEKSILFVPLQTIRQLIQ
ncbi:MAG: GNAT family N-acetyltransferase [Cyanobacteria bacterium SBLK]|nr:GNAT family N-acetyltransferase [Cyanobacteria bacterium SBLK]